MLGRNETIFYLFFLQWKEDVITLLVSGDFRNRKLYTYNKMKNCVTVSLQI